MQTYGVTDDSDGVACREAGQTGAQTCCEVDEPPEERVGLVRREVSDDQDRNDQAIHGDDTSHYDWDK